MFAFLARTVFSSVVGHLMLYIVAGAALFYFGVLYCQKTDVNKIEEMNRDLVELREERYLIERSSYEQLEKLQTALNAFKKDDKMHRIEIDALKRIHTRGCILSDEELQAHPYSRALRDGFIGRVRP